MTSHFPISSRQSGVLVHYQSLWPHQAVRPRLHHAHCSLVGVPSDRDTLVRSMDRRRFLLTLSAAPLAAQTQTLPESDLEWHDVRKFTLEGLGFKDRKAPFDRLPERAE